MRLHSVKRWHMIDTTRQQTLAEHSANVAMLAYMIAKKAPIHFFGDPAWVATAALVHDVPEAFTGDVPTHTKPHITGLDELEEAVTHPLFKVMTTQDVEALIKMCDLADGIRFIRLHGVDATARHAREGLEQQFRQRGDVLAEVWPADVLSLVISSTMFYAYENH